MSLPAAYAEEVVCPEHVVVTMDDDGTVHLLCYVGEHLPDKFMMLKHVVLVGKHAGILSPTLGPELDTDPEPGEALEVKRESISHSDELLACECGARLMPSGWCTSGHAPRDERLEALSGLGS